jgi:hypothetical protein
LTLLTKPIAAKLTGGRFALLERVFAKEAVGEVALIRRLRTCKIENRTVFFNQELPLPNIKVTKFGYQCVDFGLLIGNHVKLQLN